MEANERTTRVGKYVVTETIGAGGFGRVLKALDTSIGRTVAIKLLHSVTDPDLRTRFRGEAATTASLHHPNIVTVHEYGEHEGAPYLVMEFLEGTDLGDIVRTGTDRSGNKPSLSRKARILLDAATGLAHAHRQGVIHRDVKPANIMLLADGSCKIMDFGISRITSHQATRLTRAGFQIGTLRYMAPEQLAGHDADAITDLFGFGLVMYEFLTGRYPFTAANEAALMFEILNSDPEPLETSVPGCPEALTKIVQRALAKDRAQRYQNMEDLQLDLRLVAAELEQREAAMLVERIPGLLTEHKMCEAEALLRTALELNPGDRAAMELRERVRQEVEAASPAERAEDLLRWATELRDRREIGDAIRCLERAANLTPDDQTVHLQLEQTRAQALAASESGQFLRRAQEFWQQGSTSAAHEQARKAVEADPDNPSATSFLKAVQEYHEQTPAPSEPYVDPDVDPGTTTDRHRMLQIGFARVEELAATGQTAEAIQALELMREHFPHEQEVLRRLAELRGVPSATPVPPSSANPERFEELLSRIQPIPTSPASPAPVAAPNPDPFAPPPPSTRSPMMLAAGAAVLVILAIGIYWFTRPSATDTEAPPVASQPAPRIDVRGGPMVHVPAGPAVLGEAGTTAEVAAFYIDEHEVTNAAYLEFVNATGYARPPGIDQANPQAPVVNVSYNDAQAFAEWAGKRLPTGIEWEKAARGELGFPFPWGTEMIWTAANIQPQGGSEQLGCALPVDGRGQLPSPYGAVDMLGNAWEWVNRPEPLDQRGFNDFASRTPDFNPPLAITDPAYQIRGFSCRVPAPEQIVGTLLWEYIVTPARFRADDIGFRAARDVE